MTSKQIIDTILEDLDISKYAFTKSLNVPPQRIIDITTGKVKRLSADTIDKIIEQYPQYNRQWLMTGEGEPTNQEKASWANSGTPYYNVDFSCGYDVMENCQQITPDGYVLLPFLKDADCLINASGRSMYPLISEGDIIAIKRVNNIDNILFGEVYAIVTDDYRTIKRIRKSDKDGFFKLVPENKDYDEQDVAKESILAIFRILRAIKNID